MDSGIACACKAEAEVDAEAKAAAEATGEGPASARRELSVVRAETSASESGGLVIPRSRSRS